MDYTDIKAQLLAQQIELENRIKAISNDFKKGRSQDFAEQVTENENNEVLLGLSAEAVEELAQIKIALVRLASGQYGQCKNCGELIAEARLEALPLVTDCIDCAA